ncbi:MAG: ABC transporter permease [Longimicrobiales bacterium]
MIRRELHASVRTKAFIIGTVFGPILIAAVLFLPVLLLRGGGTTRDVVIVDATGAGIGRDVAAALDAIGADTVELASDELGGMAYVTRTRVEPDAELPAVQAELEPQVVDEAIDAFLYLPPDLLEGAQPVYMSRTVTNFADHAVVRSVVQEAVQHRRLAAAGIDAVAVRQATRPVGIDVRKAGDTGDAPRAETAFLVAIFMGFVVYTVVIIYGNAVLRGVMEEKRDKIVEVIISSIRAEQLMLGKVLGIGAASLLQVLIWVVFAGLALTVGRDVISALGADLPDVLPRVPLSIGLIFVVFFFGGFFVYAALYASMGAIATTDQEAQQMQFPVMLPLIVGIVLMQGAIASPEGAVAYWGSMIPLTSLMIMPVRAYLTRVPPLELTLSLLLLVATVLLTLWLATRIYRIGILSAGKRPSARELWRWIRAG